MPAAAEKPHLFVIIDPTTEQQIALQRAISVARSRRCRIHAFACVYEGIETARRHESRRDHKFDVVRATEERLQAWLQPCREAEIEHDSEVAWNSRWVDAALRSITRARHDLVIKSSIHADRGKRFFSERSDFSLMRYSTSPVMFTHRGEAASGRLLLACIDVDSADSAHERLNDIIVGRARSVAGLLDLQLGIAACFRNRIRIRPEMLANRFDVAPERLFLRDGPVVESLQRICREADPAVLMLGVSPRAGAGGRLIGGTAEQILDLVDADVVTVN